MTTGQSFANASAGRESLIAALRRAGLVATSEPGLAPLGGGVSSDIVVVADGSRRFVVKTALPKLRVRDDWFADVSRNGVEQAYLRRVGALLPLAVPKILSADSEGGWFAMEYFGAEFMNWKQSLLAGDADPEYARRAGETLGAIHGATWGDADLAHEFATGRNFHQLRIEPYLETSARRVPELAPFLLAEAARLGRAGLALVHGDFSPKNMLVRPGRLVLLDAEVAWFGDPAFDSAFLLTHLLLKSLPNPATSGSMLNLARIFWTSYIAHLGGRANSELEACTARLTLCLLLARIHGKSPVEYLSDPARREFVVAFVRTHLPRPSPLVEELFLAWQEKLSL